MTIRTILFFSALLLYFPNAAHGTDSKRVLEFQVYVEDTFKPVEAEITIYHNSDFEVFKKSRTVNGVLRDSTDRHGWFLIEVNSQNYFQHTDTIWITDGSQQLIQRQYALKPIETGNTFVFKDIKFYFNSNYLKEGSTTTLDSIANFLKANPSLVIEVSGHTDDEGPAEYNLSLSHGRAESIVKFLIKNGIDSSRLIAKGFGESKPIDHGITKAAKARNRRVELTVIGVRSFSTSG